MIYIRSNGEFAMPIDELYDFVTTPANWPRWHPSSLGVSDGADHSLLVGEEVTEEFRVAGRHGHVVWTVTEREPPHRWVIDGKIIGYSMGGVITYTLTESGTGTHFAREFAYPIPNLLFRVMNRLIFQRRVETESAEALRRLQALLAT